MEEEALRVKFSYDELALLEYLVACYAIGAVPKADDADNDSGQTATLHRKLDTVLTAIEEATDPYEEEQ